MSSDGVWSLPKRVAFRFGFVATALFVYPFPIGNLPKTQWLREHLGKPWTWLVVWFADSVLGVGRPDTAPNGSGDTPADYLTMLLIVILAALGAAVWSALDRRRTAYPRLADATIVVLRYVLAITLFSYGFAKIVNTQFPAPSPGRFDERIGNLSPMGMLWTFMGSSTPYTVFGGVSEALAGGLLLWRRTATLGALVAAAVMTNVVMLNLCYDVPVKLYSMQLLLLAVVIAAPHLRRLLRAVLGEATPATPPRPRGSRRVERARLIVKAVLLLGFAYGLYQEVDASLADRRPPGPLDGIWVVETWSAGGIERPPLATDDERWQRLVIDGRRTMVHPMTDKPTALTLTIDTGAQTIAFEHRGAPGTWRYTRPDAEHLVIDGGWSGKELHVTLRREPPPQLVTRGFHWIQEVPYNR